MNKSCKDCKSYVGHRATRSDRQVPLQAVRTALAAVGLNAYDDGFCSSWGDAAPTGSAQFDLGGPKFCRQFDQQA